MATVTSGPAGIDMSQPLSFFSGVTLLANTAEIDFQLSNGQVVKYFGAFVYSNGFLTSGTITGFQSYSSAGGTLLVAATGLNCSVATYISFANANDGQGLITLLLSGADSIVGSSANDLLRGYAGSNTLNGGGGTNTLDYSAAPGGVTINVSTGSASNGYGGTDTFSNFQILALPGIEWVILGDHRAGSMQVRTLRRRYSSLRNP